MWLMKTLLKSGCINQRGAGQTRCFITHHVSTHLLIFAQTLINEVVDNIRNAGTASGTGNVETGMLIAQHIRRF